MRVRARRRRARALSLSVIRGNPSSDYDAPAHVAPVAGRTLIATSTPPRTPARDWAECAARRRRRSSRRASWRASRISRASKAVAGDVWRMSTTTATARVSAGVDTIRVRTPSCWAARARSIARTRVPSPPRRSRRGISARTAPSS